MEECEEEYNKGIKDEYSESRWNDVCNIQNTNTGNQELEGHY